jgi:hypothetical protein
MPFFTSDEVMIPGKPEPGKCERRPDGRRPHIAGSPDRYALLHTFTLVVRVTTLWQVSQSAKTARQPPIRQVNSRPTNHLVT